MAYVPGQMVYIDYGENPVVMHARVILGHITGSEYLIRTPDADVYPELIDDGHPDIQAYFIGPDDGKLPVGVAPATVYGFQPMTMYEYQAMLAEGRAELHAETARRGIPPSEVPQVPGHAGAQDRRAADSSSGPSTIGGLGVDGLY